MMVLQLLKHIEATGLKEEGILRIPGSVTRVKVFDSVLMVKGSSCQYDDLGQSLGRCC